MTSTLALSPTRRQLLTQKRGNKSRLIIAVALFVAVLFADAVVIALGAANIANVAALYGAKT